MPSPIDARVPRWRPFHPLALRSVPPVWRRRLADRGSLTDEIIRACDDGFRVQVLASRVDRPRSDEAAALGMGRGHRALVREVRLLCGATPWVYARSVIPQTALRGRWLRLRRLGGRSLGALLFADPCVDRLGMEWTLLDPRLPLYQRVVEGLPGPAPDALYGRRSLFGCGRRRLLVSEFFLPAAFACG